MHLKPAGYFSGLLLMLLLMQSCATKRDFVYFSDGTDSTLYQEAALMRSGPVIASGDVLSVTISTLNPDANILFNGGSVASAAQQATGLSKSSVTPSAIMPSGSTGLSGGFMVDSAGDIHYPLLGSVHVAGLSLGGARREITTLAAQLVKDPIVNVNILNFKITVIGEVNRQGSFAVPDDKINLLEALGLAGDLTPFAERNYVWVIRNKDGVRSRARLDLTKKDIFQSPYFYLQQNDIVYVQPNNRQKNMQANSGNFQLWSLIMSSITTLSLAIYYITTVSKK